MSRPIPSFVLQNIVIVFQAVALGAPMGCATTSGASEPQSIGADVAHPHATAASAPSAAPSADDQATSEALPQEAQACDDNDAAECTKQCERGHAGSCTSLAYLYMDGKGVKKDPLQAVRLLYKACDGNDAAGCASLAFAHREGQGIRKNVVKAAEYNTKACELGNAPACTGLGYAYSEGEGAEKDVTRALSLYSKACDLGDGVGCFNAGQMNAEATGIPLDLKLASAFYRRGCDLDDSSACTQLGFLYAKGEAGFSKDVQTAATLFEKACQSGEQVACKNLRVLAREAAVPGEKAERQRAEVALPMLFARCMENRAKVQSFRVAGVNAARTGNRAQADAATQNLQALEPQWARTLEQLNSAIDLVTTSSAGERDAGRYTTLMQRFKQCSCEPTRSGRCR